MQLRAAGAERECVVVPRPPLSQAGGWQALLLSESRALLAGPPPLFQALSSRSLPVHVPDAAARDLVATIFATQLDGTRWNGLV